MIQNIWTLVHFKYQSEVWSMQVRPVPITGTEKFDVWYQPDGHEELKGFIQIEGKPTSESKIRWFQIRKKIGDVMLNEGFVQKMGEEIRSTL